MAAQLSPLSACVTKVLSIQGFPKELKTKDINQAFSAWDKVQGGFKVKWVDDTSLYVVFQDPTVAKRAYLQALCNPPPVFNIASSNSGTKIRPYNGPDAESIIQAVSLRGNGHNRGHSTRASISVGGGVAGAHARMGSFAQQRGTAHQEAAAAAAAANANAAAAAQYITMPSSTSAPQNLAFREPSPTLPNLPTQPTLNSLISSSLSSEHLAGMAEGGAGSGGMSGGGSGAPRIGDPGRRMVAHSLGMKHPGLSKSHSGEELSARMKNIQKETQGMSITE